MSTPLDSSSSLDDVQAQYDDNADYDAANDVQKARRFKQAVRIQKRRVAGDYSHGPVRVTKSENLRQLEREEERVDAWLAANDTDRRGPRSVLADFRGFR